MKNYLFIMLLAASTVLCSLACSPSSSLSITCPEQQHVTLAHEPAPTDALHLPEPAVVNDCDNASYTVDVTAGTSLVAGDNTVSYTVRNACDDVETCSFVVRASLDYRSSFIGEYAGFRDCYAWNTTQSHPDINMSVTVQYGTQPNTLLVGNDEVTIDSNGVFPYPSVSTYRRYGLSFRNDSMFMSQQWGAINIYEQCGFSGKKQ